VNLAWWQSVWRRGRETCHEEVGLWYASRSQEAAGDDLRQARREARLDIVRVLRDPARVTRVAGMPIVRSGETRSRIQLQDVAFRLTEISLSRRPDTFMHLAHAECSIADIMLELESIESNSKK
jgi:hypothetical protein